MKGQNLKIVLGLIVTLTAMGCGVNGGSRSRYSVDPSTIAGNSRYSSTGTSSGATSGDSEFSCPSGYNVMPSYDRYVNGTMKFQVCRHTSDASKIKITGSSYGDSKICVFPLEYVDENHVYPKPDLSTGGLVNKCVSATSTYRSYSPYYDFQDVMTSFPATNFNAVIIVLESNKNQLMSCLNGPAGPNFYYCPDYSYGHF